MIAAIRSAITNLTRLVFIQPYGTNLCEPQTSVWLLIARANVFVIAAGDALAWSYLGYTMAAGNARWFAATILGLVVFVFIAGLDLSFVMLDTWQPRQAGPQATSTMGQRALHWLRSNGWKARIAIASRILLVIGSFLITAPFVAQLVFWRDVRAELDRFNSNLVAARRSQLEAAHAKTRAQLTDEQRSLAERLENEIAGKGRSARFGVGPTARELQRQAALLDKRILSQDQAAATELAMYDAASPSVLALKYGVQQQQDGPDSRARAVETLRATSAGYRVVEGIIRALLFGLFVALLVLKAFQPRTVTVYFSETLQSVYAQMIRGGYDTLLDGYQRIDVTRMTALGFEEWHDLKFVDLLRAYSFQSKLDDIAAVQKMQEAGITSVETRTGDEVREMQVHLAKAVAATLALENEAQHKTDVVATLVNELTACEEDIALVETRIASVGRAKHLFAIAGRHDQLEKEVVGIRNRLAAAKVASADAERRLTISRQRRDTLDSAIQKTGMLMVKAADSLAQSRLTMLDEIMKQKLDPPK